MTFQTAAELLQLFIDFVLAISPQSYLMQEALDYSLTWILRNHFHCHEMACLRDGHIKTSELSSELSFQAFSGFDCFMCFVHSQLGLDVRR